MISKRALSIDSSGIRRVFDLAATLKNPINLSIGQPDFDVLLPVREGAKRAIDGRKGSYTVSQGIPELRQKILQKYSISDAESETDVFVTCGVTAALLLAYMTMLDPGDEILIPDPYFCLYRDQALMLNAIPTYYDTYPDFSIKPEILEAAITPRTRAMLVMSPANPTGYVLSQKVLDDIIDVARRAGIWLIFDAIYQAFSYDQPVTKIFGKYEKILIVDGFSKSHGIPGWRLGYALGPRELIAQMLKIQQYTFVCAPSVAQWAMVDAVDIDLQPQVSSYKERRDFMYQALKGNFELELPGGAFYLFPKAPGGSGTTFVEKCIANGLLVIPGNIFSRKDSHFRISYAAPLETLERGAEMLNRLAR